MTAFERLRIVEKHGLKKFYELKKKNVFVSFQRNVMMMSRLTFSGWNFRNIPTLHISLQKLLRLQRPWKIIVTHVFWKKATTKRCVISSQIRHFLTFSSGQDERIRNLTWYSGVTIVYCYYSATETIKNETSFIQKNS